MKKLKKKLKNFFKILGPGFVTGAADDDPSAVGTYAQTGALFGYSQLWLTLFSLPFMSIIQEICARIGLVTGKGISKVIKDNYSKKILFLIVSLLFITNTITIGADLGAMASSVQIVFKNISFPVILILLTVLTLILEIFVSYKVYSRFLKYLTLAFLSYILVAIVVKQDWLKVLIATIVPTIAFTKDYFINVVAFMGTTISPYAFFWQADEEVEEEITHHKIKKGIPMVKPKDFRNLKIDTYSGMFFSNLITYFIILTTASTLNAHGIVQIDTASQVADSLRPLSGDYSSLLFAIGILGSGLLAVPVLAGSASYALSEAFNWKAGLYRKFKKAHGFYGAITIATLIGLLINFTPIKPFQLLYYTSVLNGVILPPTLIIIMLISNNKKIMGEYTNKKVSNSLGWGLTGIMTVLSIITILLLFFK